MDTGASPGGNGQPGRTTADGPWTLRGYVRNAADKRAYSTLTDITGVLTGATHHLAAAPIQPRTFGLEVDYRF